MDLREFYEINILWFITPEYFDLHSEKVRAQINAIVDSAPTSESLIEQYEADLKHNALARLPQIEMPTLVTVGSFDVAVPMMYGREVAQAISAAELVVFDGGGHLHNVERPEKFNRITLDFLHRMR